MTIVIYDPAGGPDIAQGDLLLTSLRHPVFGGTFGPTPDGPMLRQGDGTVRLLEGEVTGHHHEIVFGSRHLARFRDDALAHDLAAAAPVALGTARLVQDDALLSKLIASGHWQARYRGLHIGFLVVEDGPVDLIHPEHDTWRLSPGVYTCGRQVESAGAEERMVQD